MRRPNFGGEHQCMVVWSRSSFHRLRERLALVHPRAPRPGQAFVELALVGVTAVVLLLAVADLGRAFYENMALHQAAEAGALVASHTSNALNVSNSVATQFVKDTIKQAPPNRMPIADADIILDPPSEWCYTALCETGWTPCTAFTITVNHTFNFITPFLSNSKTLPLSAVIAGRRDGGGVTSCT